MNKNVVITILLIIVFCLGGYLIFDKVICEDKNNVIDNKLDDNSQDKVVSYIEENNGIPYLTLNNLESVNEKINNFYNSTKSTYKYYYAVKNDILFLYLNKSTAVAMDGTVENEVIYIDLNKKKELKISEVVSLLVNSVEDFNNGLNGVSIDRAIIMPSTNGCIVNGKGMAEVDTFVVGCK